MVKERIIETNEGIQNEVTIEIFDAFAKGMRDRGLNNVDSFIQAGITKGAVLEIGPGPGYVGLEWLKQSQNDRLTALEISENMIHMAQKNAKDYGFCDKVTYVQGSCMEMPFEDNTFDAVFSNGSLHEWENPVEAFQEIKRVLRPNGIFCVADLRRDVNSIVKWGTYLTAKPKEIKPGFLSSLAAAYTVTELEELFEKSDFSTYSVTGTVFGLFAKAEKSNE